MASLVNTAEVEVLKWLNNASAVAPVLPWKLRLMTANGDDATGGTQVAGGSYPAGGVSVTFGAPATDGGGVTKMANSALVRIDNMPASTIVGAELWDSAGTPKRWFHGALAEPRTLLAGDPIEFAAGSITCEMQ